MPVRLQKKSVIWISSIVFLTVALSVVVFFWFNHRHQKEKYETEKVKLDKIFDSINSTYFKDVHKSLLLSNQALNISEKIGDSNFYAYALFCKSVCYFYLGNEDSTLLLCFQVQKIAERLHNDTLTAKVKNGIANYYWKKDNYYQAMIYFTDALKISERLGDKKITAMILNGLGIINKSLENYDIAIRHLEKGKKIFTELHQQHTVGIANLNIANCYMGKKEYTKAISYLQSALKTFLLFKDSTQINGTFINLGNVSRNLKNTREALKYYNLALDYSKRIKNQELLSISLLNIGIIYLETNDLALSNDFLNKSLDISSKIGSKSGEMNALVPLAEVEQKKGNIALSYAYYKRYIAVKDNIINGDTRKKIAELQWKYDFQKKEYETVLIQKKYELKKRQYLSLILLFILSIITLLVIGRNIKKSVKLKVMENKYLQDKISADEKINTLEKLKHQAEIEAKNKELTTSSLQLVTKNEILSDILAMIEKFFKANSMDETSYSNLKRVIKENQNLDKDWKQFKELFEKVHIDFFTKLKINCPDLTESELRLCAYIKINLRAKEIARILNLSADSVKVFRHRLRKKLNLPSEISIEDFVRNI